MAWLAGFWHIAGYSIAGTRVAMLLLAAFGVLSAFLLAIELGRGTPGAPAFTAIALLCVCPLFYAQSMLAQLDMPAMGFTALALLLFLQSRFRASALVCVALVMVKETGLVAPALFGFWILRERRREAYWYLLPFAALALWMVVLKHATGHWTGNREFAQYNIFYPLHPARLLLALARRFYYLFIGSGHFIGTLAVLWAWRRLPLLRDRAWRVAAAFSALHVLTVSALGGAVLERYLLPVLPVLYAAFAISLRALMPRTRNLALAGLLACLALANFINPLYPFPLENNLAFVNFVELEQKAGRAADGLPGLTVTAFPLADSLRSPEFGYVSVPCNVLEVPDFRAASIAGIGARHPQRVIVFDTAWDPLRILDAGIIRWIMRGAYNYQPPLSPDEIAKRLGMRISRRWQSGGQKMFLLEQRRK
jgi:4-amino-4-deoxy-L-arabinose transferase-like glycosyltransferase